MGRWFAIELGMAAFVYRLSALLLASSVTFGACVSAWAVDYTSLVNDTSGRVSVEIPVGRTSLETGTGLYGALPGYTDDIDDEVSTEPTEMILMEKPEFLNGPDLHSRIFNNVLTNEFLFQYQQKFGRTEQEENYFLVNKQGYYYGADGLTATQIDDERRKFAEYMTKRLVEFHTENIMKTDPALKKVYEAKQAISNVKLEVGPQVRFDMVYSFVGNFANFVIHNPWAESKVTIWMDPGSIVPTAPSEMYFVSQKPLSRTIRAEAGLTFYNKALKFLLVKQLSPVMAVNISESLPVVDLQIDNSREGLSMAGFSFVF